jgi:hypothetical protein
MNRLTQLAMFLANLALVIGPFGLLKSIVGICLVQARYPGHYRREGEKTIEPGMY